MSSTLPERLLIECPAEPDWEAAQLEVHTTKPAEGADVIEMLEQALHVHGTVSRQIMLDEGGRDETVILRDYARWCAEKALRWFRDDFSGQDTIELTVQPEQWSRHESWAQCPDAQALVLFKYGVLQAAGFSLLPDPPA